MTNAELRAFLPVLCHVESGGVTEVCVFQGGKKPTHVGYFDDLDKAAKAIEAHDGRGNIFVTLNSAKRSLLARCNNRLVEGTYKNPAERTKDTEIHRDSWFLVDVDPKRPSGISSTDEEKRQALEAAKAVRDWLLSVGVPASAMMTCDSGNGAYVLVRTLDCKVTDERAALKKAFLNFVADKFDAEQVEIDRTVYNPSRLIGALGSIKVKGENIPERPHRRSSVRTIAGEPFEPLKAQRCEPFDLYVLARKILPAAEEEKPKQAAGNKSAGGDYNGFDARKIAHLLKHHKPTSNGFDRYDCPSCENTQKFWVRAADGKFGCYEPMSVCDWRKLRDKLCEMAIEAGIEERESQPKVERIAVSWGELCEMEFERRETILHEVERGEIVMCPAITNRGKTTLWRNVALSLACGREFAPIVDAGTPRSVLYLDFETRLYRARSDINKMLGELTEPERALISTNLHLVADCRINGRPLTLSEPHHLEIVEAEARRVKADVIILDTLTAAFEVEDENSNAEAARVMKKLTALALRLNCVIVFLHHIGKAKQEEGQTVHAVHRARGASAYSGFSHAIFSLLPDPILRERNTLECSKVKGERFEDTIFNLNLASRWFVSAGAAVKGPTPYEQVIAVFNGQPLNRAKVLELLPKLSADTIDRQLRAAVDAKELVKEKKGRSVEYKKPDNPHDPHPHGPADRADYSETVEEAEDSLDFGDFDESDKNELADYSADAIGDDDEELF